ncbi:MAG: D-tyrosyl-tRNA(Tyr) deacylase [Oscillospiraceae bacterium]|jgi:D-tyrosyl-tRNA(Tyr) deacylase|nr:D-tyrosyl-tRNA(Tyr) deacylase [Oscillospiraceae bacterium]
MRAVISRVHSASVTTEGRTVGRIGKGFLVLLGVGQGDTEREADWLADRVCKLRVFEDGAGKMNVAPAEAGASLLVVSNFTLYGDCVRTRRPSFSHAAPPEAAVPLYERFIAQCRGAGLPVETGVFGADMRVSSEGDGPVTLQIDSDDRGQKTES